MLTHAQSKFYSDVSNCKSGRLLKTLDSIITTAMVPIPDEECIPGLKQQRDVRTVKYAVERARVLFREVPHQPMWLFGKNSAKIEETTPKVHPLLPNVRLYELGYYWKQTPSGDWTVAFSAWFFGADQEFADPHHNGYRVYLPCNWWNKRRGWAKPGYYWALKDNSGAPVTTSVILSPSKWVEKRITDKTKPEVRLTPLADSLVKLIEENN